MGEMNTAAISANELVLIMSSIGVLGVIGGWIGEKLNIPDVVIYLILGVLLGIFLNTGIRAAGSVDAIVAPNNKLGPGGNLNT